MRKILAAVFIFYSSIIFTVNAGVEVNEFSSQKDEQQFKKLVTELRCLVCQNQNLADSNAELAQDLRKEVFQMIQKGQTSEEIIEFMVARYGDFVLYRPPFKPETFLLWLGPFFILLFAFLFLIIFIKKKKTINQCEITDQDKLRAERLIESISGEKD